MYAVCIIRSNHHTVHTSNIHPVYPKHLLLRSRKLVSLASVGTSVLKNSLTKFIFTILLQWQPTCEISALFGLCTQADFIVCHYFSATWNLRPFLVSVGNFWFLDHTEAL